VFLPLTHHSGNDTFKQKKALHGLNVKGLMPVEGEYTTRYGLRHPLRIRPAVSAQVFASAKADIVGFS